MRVGCGGAGGWGPEERRGGGGVWAAQVCDYDPHHAGEDIWGEAPSEVQHGCGEVLHPPQGLDGECEVADAVAVEGDVVIGVRQICGPHPVARPGQVLEVGQGLEAAASAEAV